MSDLSDAFRKMADAIDHNDGKLPFGGAFVIVPPSNENEPPHPLSLLILDTTNNPAQFWGTLKAKADLTIRQLDDVQRMGQGFPRR